MSSKEKKDIQLPPPGQEESEKAVVGQGLAVTQVKPIRIANWRKEVEIVGPLVAGSFFMVLISVVGLLANPENFLPIMPFFLPGVGLGSIVAAYLNSFEVRQEKVQKALLAEGKALSEDEIAQAWKEHLPVNTFYVKEKVDVEIDQWIEAKNSVEEKDATHTIRQYLRKTKQGYQLEQEVTPNEETIWDLSADALAEVYGVQEVKSIDA